MKRRIAPNRKGPRANEWILPIHFNDLDIVLNNLEDIGIQIDGSTNAFLRNMHESVSFMTAHLPACVCNEIYYRAANQIIKYLKSAYGLKSGKYKKSDYLLY